MLEFSTPYKDFPSFPSHHPTDQKKKKKSFNPLREEPYNESQFRCGVNIMIPAGKIDARVVLGEQGSVSAQSSNFRGKEHWSVLTVTLEVFLLLHPTRSYQEAWQMIKHHTQMLCPKRPCLGNYSGQVLPGHRPFQSLLAATEETSPSGPGRTDTRRSSGICTRAPLDTFI